ncbi:MAG: hypothetical protein A3F11_00235 [Gammaproteobacteria bacterium RIFCSPHIGHO2_12_FULL_37_14]|nr:MAG: hypothetical protein A3F11_00235 [Gammaproteobacteria bacterium RIFCSPHIGHO2_12_FULL_37_14]
MQSADQSNDYTEILSIINHQPLDFEKLEGKNTDFFEKPFVYRLDNELNQEKIFSGNILNFAIEVQNDVDASKVFEIYFQKKIKIAEEKKNTDNKTSPNDTYAAYIHSLPLSLNDDEKNKIAYNIASTHMDYYIQLASHIKNQQLSQYKIVYAKRALEIIDKIYKIDNKQITSLREKIEVEAAKLEAAKRESSSLEVEKRKENENSLVEDKETLQNLNSKLIQYSKSSGFSFTKKSKDQIDPGIKKATAEQWALLSRKIITKIMFNLENREEKEKLLTPDEVTILGMIEKSVLDNKYFITRNAKTIHTVDEGERSSYDLQGTPYYDEGLEHATEIKQLAKDLQAYFKESIDIPEPRVRKESKYFLPERLWLAAPFRRYYDLDVGIQANLLFSTRLNQIGNDKLIGNDNFAFRYTNLSEEKTLIEEQRKLISNSLAHLASILVKGGLFYSEDYFKLMNFWIGTKNVEQAKQLMVYLKKVQLNNQAEDQKTYAHAGLVYNNNQKELYRVMNYQFLIDRLVSEKLSLPDKITYLLECVDDAEKVHFYKYWDLLGVQAEAQQSFRDAANYYLSAYICLVKSGINKEDIKNIDQEKSFMMTAIMRVLGQMTDSSEKQAFLIDLIRKIIETKAAFVFDQECLQILDHPISTKEIKGVVAQVKEIYSKDVLSSKDSAFHSQNLADNEIWCLPTIWDYAMTLNNENTTSSLFKPDQKDPFLTKQEEKDYGEAYAKRRMLLEIICYPIPANCSEDEKQSCEKYQEQAKKELSKLISDKKDSSFTRKFPFYDRLCQFYISDQLNSNNSALIQGDNDIKRWASSYFTDELVRTPALISMNKIIFCPTAPPPFIENENENDNDNQQEEANTPLTIHPAFNQQQAEWQASFDKLQADKKQLEEQILLQKNEIDELKRHMQQQPLTKPESISTPQTIGMFSSPVAKPKKNLELPADMSERCAKLSAEIVKIREARADAELEKEVLQTQKERLENKLTKNLKKLGENSTEGAAIKRKFNDELISIKSKYTHIVSKSAELEAKYNSSKAQLQLYQLKISNHSKLKL